ncbi:hypothetical protein ACHAW5_003534 [Stephanodiscus triporus]|uniref:Uncharacterized protein n=1 Tax=Stephanodiscus triporus TaxID=2934178 RepID=A0ABD3PZU3_9STRA
MADRGDRPRRHGIQRHHGAQGHGPVRVPLGVARLSFPPRGTVLCQHFHPLRAHWAFALSRGARGGAAGCRRSEGQTPHGGHEAKMSDGLPPYIKCGIIEEEQWKRSHPSKTKTALEKDSSTMGSTPAHNAAQRGDVDKLNSVIESMVHLLDAKDMNRWMPLHEGARGGHESAVRPIFDGVGHIEYWP